MSLTSYALRERLRLDAVVPQKRGWYRAGYARALDDIASVLRGMSMGVPAGEIADAIDRQAESIRRGKERQS